MIERGNMDAMVRELMELESTCEPAEVEMLKQSRAAAVEQEQLSRAECNRLRGEVKQLKNELDVALLILKRNSLLYEYYTAKD